jgi:hypothetical protein
MIIKRSSKEVKTCAKCHENVYTFEARKNRNNGDVEHLQCPVKGD